MFTTLRRSVRVMFEQIVLNGVACAYIQHRRIYNCITSRVL
jgi:hypothetical protein